MNIIAIAAGLLGWLVAIVLFVWLWRRQQRRVAAMHDYSLRHDGRRGRHGRRARYVVEDEWS